MAVQIINIGHHVNCDNSDRDFALQFGPCLD